MASRWYIWQVRHRHHSTFPSCQARSRSSTLITIKPSLVDPKTCHSFDTVFTDYTLFLALLKNSENMQRFFALTALALGAGVYGQQAGTSTAEVHPSMPWSLCSKGGSCTQQKGSVVLDSNWRWVHNVGGYTNCYSVR